MTQRPTVLLARGGAGAVTLQNTPFFARSGMGYLRRIRRYLIKICNLQRELCKTKARRQSEERSACRILCLSMRAAWCVTKRRGGCSVNVFEIVFSPTGGTERVSGLVTGALDGNTVTVDLTDSGQDFHGVSMTKDDVAVISVPSYAGRVPAVVVDRLGMVRGNGARAVLVCVYGNRAFEDTLVELEDVAKSAGFRVVAAVAAIAEHSVARQFAAGRPDAQDVAQLAEFAQRIRQKLLDGDMSEPSIPGNRPYKQAGGHSMVPQTTEDCVSCGACTASCPVCAIDKDDPKQVDGEVCVSCMRCVAVCPRGARKLDPNKLAAVTQMLSKACVERRECELFI